MVNISSALSALISMAAVQSVLKSSQEEKEAAAQSFQRCSKECPLR